MRVLLINLQSSEMRRAFQVEQAARLGLSLEIVDAISTKELDPDLYFRLRDVWERPMLETEVACFLSHRLAWQKVVNHGSPMLILEDDAVLSKRTPAFLREISTLKGIDRVSLETRGRKKIVGPNFQQVAGIGLRRLYLDKSGAAAYVLWPDAANKLLSKTNTTAGLADAILCSADYLETYQSDPALAVQADMCERYGIRAPIPVASTINRTNESLRPEAKSMRALIRCRIRRMKGQFRIGFLHKHILANAKRIEIDFDSQN